MCCAKCDTTVTRLRSVPGDSVGDLTAPISMLNTILDLIPNPAVCGQEIQCRKQGIVAAVHVPADIQEHGAVCVVSK